MAIRIRRCGENPIIRPGVYPWRMAVTFNPGVLYEDGRFYLYERAAAGLRPFHCVIGMLESEDGVHFTHTVEQPVFTPAMAGSEYGSVQDPRVVRIEDSYYMTYAFRPFAWHCLPTGVGVPDAHQGEYPGFDGSDEINQTRSGIAVSTDRVTWRHLAWVSGTGIDDRNVVLFPEKIGGRYAALRRPQRHVATDTAHDETEAPAIRISYSDDLATWTEPEVVIRPEFAWESNRIGASTPPIRTNDGWLILYHGVENTDLERRGVCYRMSAFLVDLDDPTRIIARPKDFLMEPEEYYEKWGLFIPNVIFPTGAVVVDGLLHIYYGCCDTAIALATVPLEEVVRWVRAG